ncbi:MAG: PKD domain-containing protein [Solirubrobacteraceae bacterium]
MLVLLALIAGVAGAGASSSYAGAWSFAEFHSEGSGPRVAMNEAGEAVIAYQGYGETIRVSRRMPDGSFTGGVFGEPVFPEPQTCCLRPAEPSVAIDPSGGMVVVWQEDAWGSSKPEIYASFAQRGGAFGSPELVSTEGAYAPEVAIDSRGEAVAVWLRDDGVSTVVEAAFSSPGGSFSEPAALSGDGDDAAAAQVKMDGDGEAIASWIRASGGSSQLEVAVRRAGGSFPAPDGSGNGTILGESLAAPAVSTERLPQRVALTAGLEGVATWQAPSGAVQDARLGLGQSTFGAASTIGSAIAAPTIAANTGGEVVIAWPMSSGIDVATATPGGAFGAPEEIPLESTPDFAGVYIAPSGEVLAAGLSSYHEGFYWIAQQGATRPPGGVFAEAKGLWDGSEGEQSGDDLELAGDSLGDVVGVFEQVTTIGAEFGKLVYDHGPAFAGISVPATARAGEPVELSIAEPETLWSPLTGVSWSFGDGTSGSGLSTSHTYAQPGVYQVTITAADGQQLMPFNEDVSNSVTRSITITPATNVSVPSTQSSRQQPTITSLTQSHRLWRERAGHAGKRLPTGTTFSISVNMRATLKLVFAQRLEGHRIGRRCTVSPRHSTSRRCALTLERGVLLLEAPTGDATRAFAGHLPHGVLLTPGRYVMTATAITATGERSAPMSVDFTIAS